jgi:hypothetical protein
MPARIALQSGVSWENDVLVDSATRERFRIPGSCSDPQVAARVLLLGLGYTPYKFTDRATLIWSALPMRTTSPWRMLRFGFRRRIPGPSLSGVVLAACVSSRLPAIGMLAIFLAPAMAFGFMSGSFGKFTAFAMYATCTCWASMLTHEIAHLVMIRVVERDQSVGAIVHSWLNVWIVGPALAPWRRRMVAIIGPLAGVAACFVLGLVGVPRFIWLGIAVIHLMNLLPAAPDGRALLS